MRVALQRVPCRWLLRGAVEFQGDRADLPGDPQARPTKFSETAAVGGGAVAVADGLLSWSGVANVVVVGGEALGVGAELSLLAAATGVTRMPLSRPPPYDRSAASPAEATKRCRSAR